MRKKNLWIWNGKNFYADYIHHRKIRFWNWIPTELNIEVPDCDYFVMMKTRSTNWFFVATIRRAGINITNNCFLYCYLVDDQVSFNGEFYLNTLDDAKIFEDWIRENYPRLGI